MPELLLIVPTRGRRANVERLVASCAITRAMDTKILFITDHDDDSYDGLLLPPWAQILQGPRDVISKKVNRHALSHAGVYRALMYTGDDHVPETWGWDGLLAAAARNGMSYPDTCSRKDIPECVVIDSRIVRALRWLYPPFVRHFYADNVWGDLGGRAGCLSYVPGVLFRHHHHSLMPGEVEYDETYRLSEEHGAPDREAWEAWRDPHTGQMQSDIDRVRAARAFP